MSRIEWSIRWLLAMALVAGWMFSSGMTSSKTTDIAEVSHEQPPQLPPEEKDDKNDKYAITD